MLEIEDHSAGEHVAAPRQRTAAVHAGEPKPPIADAITMPIFQSSSYLLGSPEEFDDIRYIRLNNTPNHEALACKLASLERTEAALVTPSGTAAISAVFFSYLRAGDHVIAPEQLYGGTRKILERLITDYGIAVSFVPYEDPAAWERALEPRTRLLYVEPLVNPTLQVPRLDELVAFAKGHRLISVADNTLLSPYNFRPAEMGFDLVLHSASKYLNGHSDVVAGVVAGAGGAVRGVRKTLNLFGACLDPHACFLLQRGLKTLPLRVAAQNESALALARALREHPAVERVHYTGLVEDPSHARAVAWFSGHGGVLSLRVHGGVAAAEQLLERLEYARVAPSFGGVQTFASRPATTSHAGLPKALRQAMGVSEDLVRVAVGLEDPGDLIADFRQAMAAIRA
ncbi:MAG TPA: aminotransferase class I/II-fold pyridoxal phosphate-dependent enzyme [Polyangiaceae bacterium]|nr:aminotransferase class I/II-fold pyridoxal phosphate-dependent enzyme [Polyangiaceae bacterium]